LLEDFDTHAKRMNFSFFQVQYWVTWHCFEVEVIFHRPSSCACVLASMNV
jgi:hypothetical protein